MIEHTISLNESGQRLDRFLRKKFPDVALSVLFAVLRKRKVRVNGKIAKAPLKMEMGDLVQIFEELSSKAETPIATASASQLAVPSPVSEWEEPLHCVSRNEGFLVVDKPSGMPSQPGSGIAPGTSLVERVWQQEGIGFDGWRPALAHRLDQETSGLVVIGLDAPSLRTLAEIFRSRQVRKEYKALVLGTPSPAQGIIELSLQREDSARGAKMVTGQGQRAVTTYEVESVLGAWSLVRIGLETGRMHQIRAHFAHIGHPLAGDGRYGDFAANRQLRKSAGLRRLFLHAHRLVLPWQGQSREFSSALPSELLKVIEQLKAPNA